MITICKNTGHNNSHAIFCSITLQNLTRNISVQREGLKKQYVQSMVYYCNIIATCVVHIGKHIITDLPTSK